MPAWSAVACIVVALVAAAFFAGAETALTAASRARLRALQTAGDERAVGGGCTAADQGEGQVSTRAGGGG